jgi:predicted RNase H-like HicB family nuclease
MNLTQICRPTATGFEAFIEEIPELRAEGATPEEASEKLAASVDVVLNAVREVIGDEPI